jgi:hypothetical protein
MQKIDTPANKSSSLRMDWKKRRNQRRRPKRNKPKAREGLMG